MRGYWNEYHPKNIVTSVENDLIEGLKESYANQH